MTPDEQRIAEVEADRKKRERELLALLLLMMEDTRQHAQSAIKLGVDPTRAAYNVIFGAPHIDQAGYADKISLLMADAYSTGESRVAKWADVEIPSLTSIEEKEAAVARHYADFVQRALNSLYDAVVKKVQAAVGAGEGIKATMKLVRLNMEAAGLTGEKSTATALASEQAILTAYNGGMFAGYASPLVGVRLVGFRHKSVLDNHTTLICNERDGLVLSKSNPYWQKNWCPLHFHCRSVIVPIFNDERFMASEWLPTEPPDTGFGAAPAWVSLLGR